jgi:hypothetical protein
MTKSCGPRPIVVICCTFEPINEVHRPADPTREASVHVLRTSQAHPEVRANALFERRHHLIPFGLELLDQIEPAPCDKVGLGAILITNQGNYFVSTGLIDEGLTVAGKQYEFISLAAPFIRQLRCLTKGAVIKTPGGVTTVVDIL